MKPLHNLILLFVLTLQTAQLCYSQATRETAQLLTTPVTFEVDTKPGYYWYKYIADSVCTVSLSTDFSGEEYDSPIKINLYKNSNENYLWYDGSVSNYNIIDDNIYKSEVSITINKGDTVYFQLRKRIAISIFKATFQVTESTIGLSFNTPIPVSLDTIPILFSNIDKNHLYNYYEISAKEDMKVDIFLDSVGVYPKTYRKMQDGTYLENSTRGIIYAGETYLFELRQLNASIDHYSLISSTIDEIGTECSYPRKIDSFGVFELDNTKESEWIKFFAEESGYYTVSIDDTTNSDILILKNDWAGCSYFYKDTITSKKIEIYVYKGNWMLLEIQGDASGVKYNATLSYVAEKLGDKCENPLPIFQDSIYTVHNPMSYFQFTPTKSDDYLITINKEFNTDIEVLFKQDCNPTNWAFFFFSSPIDDSTSIIRFNLVKDSTYLLAINFQRINLNVKFTISNYIPQKAETCNDAIEIKNKGKHIIDHPARAVWLKYVTEASGTMFVSTLDSTYNCTYIQAYKNDCNTLIAECEWYNESTCQSYIKFNVSEGDTILIKSNAITQHYSGAYPIFIDYKEIFKYGMSCERPLPIAEIPSSITTENFTESEVIYYSFSTENETEVTISDLSKANIFQLFSACSKRVATSERGEVSVIIPAGNYQIQWQNITEEPINWNISFNNNPDTDKDGKPNTEDEDDDNDGVLDSDDAFPYDKSETADNDKDGIGDNADTDDDNDGILDIYDSTPFGSVSVVETSEQTDFKVIPNPAHDKIQLTGLAAHSTVSLKIIDSKGAVVLSQESYLCGTDIDVRKLKKGRYYILINNKGEAKTASFTKF